jgi:hypothetical protein
MRSQVEGWIKQELHGAGGLSARQGEPDPVQGRVTAQDAPGRSTELATQTAAGQSLGHAVIVRSRQPTWGEDGQVEFFHQDGLCHKTSFLRPCSRGR